MSLWSLLVAAYDAVFDPLGRLAREAGLTPTGAVFLLWCCFMALLHFMLVSVVPPGDDDDGNEA
jgi:hypothetical protein